MSRDVPIGKNGPPRSAPNRPLTCDGLSWVLAVPGDRTIQEKLLTPLERRASLRRADRRSSRFVVQDGWTHIYGAPLPCSRRPPRSRWPLSGSSVRTESTTFVQADLFAPPSGPSGPGDPSLALAGVPLNCVAELSEFDPIGFCDGVRWSGLSWRHGLFALAIALVCALAWLGA